MKRFTVFRQRLRAIATRFGSTRTRILFDFCIISAIAVVVFRNFLFTGGWPAGGDALGVVSRAYLFGHDLRWLFVWRPHSFGFTEIIHGYDFFLMVLYWIFGNAVSTAKVFLFLTFAVSGFSSYILAYWYTKNSTASLAAGLVYMLNQWLFSQYTEAHGDILFSYALAPLVFLSIFRAFETKKPKSILIAGVALAILVSAFHPECAVIYGASFPIFALIYVLMPPNSTSRLQQLKNLFKIGLPLLAVCLILASFLVIPFAFNVRPRYYTPSYKYYLEETYGGVYRNLTDAFTLSAVEVWGYVNVVDVINGVALPDLPAKLFSIVLFSLACCTVLIRRDKYSIFFFASALFSMFVAKGPYPPFGSVYLWAWLNVPYFAVFRAANRWIMMTCLSFAFLTASLVNILLRYIREKKYRVIGDAFSKIDIKATSTKSAAVRLAGGFFTRFHMILYYASILLIAMIFLNGFLSTWFFFEKGLQVYMLPESYVNPYSWLGSVNGDYKIMSINRDPSRWMNRYSSGYDFAFSAMLTDVGWAHDIGYDSSFLTDKPSMQDGGWDANVRDFMNYLRFRLVGQHKTRDFLKLTGLFNYKYLVLPAYLDPDARDFFLNQNGAKGNLVYDENGSMILKNPYYVPRFFAMNSKTAVLGGFISYPSLCKLDAFTLNDTNLLFLNKLDSDPLDELRGNATTLAFVNTNLIDLTMLRLKGKATMINMADYGVYSFNSSKYWIQSSSWQDVGALVYGGKTISTAGNVSVEVPFEVSADGAYDLWARVGFVSGRGKLEISVDGNFAGEVKPESDYWNGLFWVNIQTVDLKKGNHKLTLTNRGPGYNDVDTIALIEPALFQSTYDETLQFVDSFQGRVIDLISAVNLFAYDLPEGWSICLQQYEDDLLKNDNFLVTIREHVNASASSFQGNLTPLNAIDDSMSSRWASDPSQETPQWFQVDWPTVQEVAGVRIYFETAYAQNYTIQTWDGQNWITQVDITGNKLLSPTHLFKQPVRTNKLMLNVTGYGTPHHLVSMFKFEPCRLSTITATHFVPKSGRYMIALRLASGPSYGTLNLKIDNETLVLNSNSTQEDFQWFETGPIQLEKGERNFSVCANGTVILDQMILYSFRENENSTVLKDLFNPSSSSPEISYTKINPTEFRVHISAEQPFQLVFSETFHPMWKAKFDDGQEISATTAYSIVNSFYINRTGEFDLTVYFEGQRFADIGLQVSLVSLITVSVVVLTPIQVASYIKKRVAFWRKPLWRQKNRS